MENKREMIKMKDNINTIIGSSSFSDIISTGFPFSSTTTATTMFDYSSDQFGEKGSLGFMELLGGQDYFTTTTSPPPNSFFDFPSLASNIPTSTITTTAKKEVSTDAFNNQPATPNTSSISSASSEALNEEQTKTGDPEEGEEEQEQEQEQPKITNKQ